MSSFSFSSLACRCKVCAEKMSTIPAKIALDTSVINNFQLSLDSLRLQVDSIGQRIDVMQKEILSKLDGLNQSTGTALSEINIDETVKEKRTYADAVSTNLSSIVKSAVISTFKQ